jgi:hypothetical protein
MQHGASLVDDAEGVGFRRLGCGGAGEKRDAGEEAGEARR